MEEGWWDTSGAYGKLATFRGENSQNSPQNGGGWYESPHHDIVEIEEVPWLHGSFHTPCTFPTPCASVGSWESPVERGCGGWGCVCHGAESCSAGATWGRVGVTPCAESAHLLSWEKVSTSGATMALSKRQCLPSPPVAEQAPIHAITKAGISTPCQHRSHKTDPQRTHPYPDGQSCAYLCQLASLTEHRGSLAS